MSLPPGFLDELRTRLSLTDVVGRKVMWDKRKSQPGKGDMWAPCPFHHEKTASFHVDDRKGFYYCFGCHAKGDAISFVKDTENVGFMEAVEILAGEAGMQMPARDPRAQEKADRRTLLAEVMEMAVSHYQLMLKTGAGTEAREYLSRRGLNEAAQARWAIGFAPDAWQGLWDHLKSKGVEDDLILGAGLAKPSTKGGKPYDTFRGRIMFPIRDARGRAIAFGGRAMDPNDNAKYLNSPETELFDKGRSLYNQGPAREASGKGKPLIVAEGYMDVIALSEAGFDATVAPLGTAITEDQLRLMWRINPEPIIALDGDTAGLRAAMRVIDLALPLLEAGKSLRFATMPEGQDPDDVLKLSGPKAMGDILKRAIPMVDLLWQREVKGKKLDSPERKAALDKALDDVVARISDTSIRSHYVSELRSKKWQAFRGEGRASSLSHKATVLSPPAAKHSYLADVTADQITPILREAAILALIVKSPEIAENFLSELERIEFEGPFHERLKASLLEALEHGAVPAYRINRILREKHGAEVLENVFAYTHVQLVIRALEPNNPDAGRQAVMEELAKLQTERALKREVEEAIADFREAPDLVDEGLTWRLSQAAEARNRAVRSQSEDRTTYERAENGLLMDRDERDALDRLISTLNISKQKGDS